jgi:hypothetical protein
MLRQLGEKINAEEKPIGMSNQQSSSQLRINIGSAETIHVRVRVGKNLRRAAVHQHYIDGIVNLTKEEAKRRGTQMR